MKLALLSDLHANVRALQACLDHARAAGATRFAILGDLVGYGPEPAEVVDAVAELQARGAVVLRGNHDQAAVTPPPAVRNQEEATAAWTHSRLSDAHRRFLSELPLTATLGTTFLVHASADAPPRWNYIDSPRRAAACIEAASQALPDVRHIFCGHVHEQALYYRGRGREPMLFTPVPGAPVMVPPPRVWVATVGSTGQPRDGDPRAMYALFDDEQARLTFHRIPYDHPGAAAAVRRAGQPEHLARRLEEGR